MKLVYMVSAHSMEEAEFLCDRLGLFVDWENLGIQNKHPGTTYSCKKKLITYKHNIINILYFCVIVFRPLKNN